MPIIAFEGVDGCGKSTLLNAIARELEDHWGQKVCTWREPGSTPIGETIRTLLKTTPIEPLTELLLLEASRRQLVQMIRQTLEKKPSVWVLLDRFAASSVAFQGFGRGLPLWLVQLLNSQVTNGIPNALHVWLKVPIEKARQRLQKRPQWDRFEKEPLEFWHKVQAGYEAQVKHDPESWVVLDGQLPVNQLIEALIQRFQEKSWLPIRKSSS